MKKYSIVLLLLLSFSFSSGQYTSTDTLSYYSAYFGERRNLKISLPSEYGDHPNRRYNVVYLFDAQSTALYDFTKSTLSFFQQYSNSYYDPVVFVGIETRNRHFEFLPKHLHTEPSAQNYFMAGGADTLALSIEKEVKPLIEKKYRTTGFSTGIGHSLGATFVTYSMLRFPGIFSAGVCVSPNYVFDKEAIFSLLSTSASKNKDRPPLLYIAYGHGDDMEERFKKSTVAFKKDLSEHTYQSKRDWFTERLNKLDKK